MCGRFAQVIKHQQLKKLQDEQKLKESSEQIELNYNVAPTQTVAAIVEQGSVRYFGYFRWGLIPSWKKEVPASAMINVRSESILEKPSFKASFIRRRCLVPANGFYEWRTGDKQPFFIKAANDDLLFMAGIYDAWYGADGSYIPSLGIITTAANDLMKPLHHRMPLLFTRNNWDAWLDPQNQDLHNSGEASLLNLLIPSAEIQLSLHPVSKRVNNVHNNDPECLQEI